LKFFKAEDIFLVDDGSQDKSLTNFLEKTGVNIIKHSTNLGKGAALRSGFSIILKRDYTHVLMADADGQHPLEHYPRFLRLAKRYDMVIGSRLGHMGGMPIHRQLSNRITSTFISVMVGKRIEDSQSGYRLISRRILERVSLSRNHYDLESELLVKALWMGFTVGFVSVPVVPSSKSFIHPLQDVLRALSLAVELLAGKA